MRDKVSIAITCIGSGIGQSILDSVRLSPLPLRTVGVSNDLLAYGVLDCDLHEYLPSIYEASYIGDLLNICIRHSVKLVIPGTDDDALVLSNHKKQFDEHGVVLLASNYELISLCRDKEMLYKEFHLITDDFALTLNKDDCLQALNQGGVSFPCVVKPRDGSASIGVNLASSINEIFSTDDNYIVQELIYPEQKDPNFDIFSDGIKNGQILQLSEISVQIITDIDGKVIGKAATRNKLKNGIPVEIVPIDDESIWSAVDKLTPKLLELGMRGPLNLQGRMTDTGVRWFEINPRFTGISGTRALMGFNEVEACIKSFLGMRDQTPFLAINHKKYGVRQVADKTGCIANSDNQIMLVTGSTGYIGRNFINDISKTGSYSLWTLGFDKQNARNLFNGKVDRYFDRADLSNGNIPWGRIDVVLHFGFARPHCTSEEIADSITFTRNVFMYAGMNNVSSIINASSQSVYGQATRPLWKEESPISPETPYAMAKYASELYLQTEKERNKQINITSLRLASLTGGQDGLVFTDLPSRFVKLALEGEPLNIYGEHVFERLDVRDAVGGLIKLLAMPHEKWRRVYNLGSGETFSIDELAKNIIEQVQVAGKGKGARIVKLDRDKSLYFGMNSERFFKDTGWKPQYSLVDSIASLVEYID